MLETFHTSEDDDPKATLLKHLTSCTSYRKVVARLSCLSPYTLLLLRNDRSTQACGHASECLSVFLALLTLVANYTYYYEIGSSTVLCPIGVHYEITQMLLMLLLQ